MSPDRRAFLMRSAAALAAAPLLLDEGCSQTSQERAAALTGSPTPQQMSDFVALSSALLGVAAAKLAPDPDYGDMKSECFGAAQRSDPQRLATLLQAYAQRPASASPEATAAWMLDDRRDPEVAFFARAVMLAWLLGSWYDPAALASASASGGGPPIASAVISANAYRESWAWKIGQSKPMGTSTQGFGSWSAPPPPLANAIGEA